MGSRRVASSLARVFVGNIPWTIGNRELKQFFTKFGPVAQVNVIFDKKTGVSKGYGFVQFVKKDSIESVKDNKHILEGQVLNIQTATTT